MKKILLAISISSLLLTGSCAVQPSRSITITVPTSEAIEVPVEVQVKCGENIKKTLEIKKTETLSVGPSLPCSTLAFHGTSSIRHESLRIYHPYYKFYKNHLYGIINIDGEHKPIYDIKELMGSNHNLTNNELRLIILDHYHDVLQYVHRMKKEKRIIPTNIQNFILELSKFGVKVVSQMTDNDFINLEGYQYKNVSIVDRRSMIIQEMNDYSRAIKRSLLNSNVNWIQGYD